MSIVHNITLFVCLVGVIFGCKSRDTSIASELRDQTVVSEEAQLSELCQIYEDLSVLDQKSLEDIMISANSLLAQEFRGRDIPDLRNRTVEMCDLLEMTIPLFSSYVVDCRLTDVQPPLLELINIRKLIFIDVGRCENIERLKALPKLVDITFYPNDGIPLTSTYNRKYSPPSTRGRQVIPFAALSQIKELKSIDAIGCANNNAEALASLEWLEELWLRHCNIESIEFVSHMGAMHELVLSGNNISDFWPLMGLGNIRKLKLDSNKRGQDLEPIGMLASLEELWLQDNRIVDIKPLGNLRNLHRLLLGDNPIEDISPLRSLPKLSDLSIITTRLAHGDRATTRAVISSLPALKKVYLDSRVWTLDDLEPTCADSVEGCYLFTDQIGSDHPVWFE